MPFKIENRRQLDVAVDEPVAWQYEEMLLDYCRVPVLMNSVCLKCWDPV